MELEEQKPSTEIRDRGAQPELIEEQQQMRTYLSGWRLRVLTGGYEGSHQPKM